MLSHLNGVPNGYCLNHIYDLSWMVKTHVTDKSVRYILSKCVVCCNESLINLWALTQENLSLRQSKNQNSRD